MKCMLHLTVHLEPEGQEEFRREVDMPYMPEPGTGVCIHEMYFTKVKMHFIDIYEGEAFAVIILDDIIEKDIQECIKRQHPIQEELHLAGWQ